MRKVIYQGEKAIVDSGIFFGRGVFETILIKEKPIFLREHLERLNNGIEVLKIGKSLEFLEIEKEIGKLRLNNCVLKIIVTEKNIIINNRKVPYNENTYKFGFNIKISKVLRNSTSLLTYIKSCNYMDNLLEKESAYKEGYNEVLFLNEKGFLTEGATTNLFIVERNKIITPKIECGLLNGTVRKFIINKFNVYEEEITLDRLLKSDEVFLTNSLVGVIKVSNIENKSFKNNIKVDYIRKVYEDYIAKAEGVQ
ncbi:aminotransferase class IV [Clostridium carnis]